jgi:two-component system, chemotaxis family, sensor kinase CheA
MDPELEAFAADPELGGLFVAEGLDHLGTIEASVLKLEASPGDKRLLNDIFRPFHTIKGNAGVLGLASIQEFAHKVETLLDLARSGRHQLRAADFDLVLKAVDLLTVMIRELPARAEGQRGTDVSARRRHLMETVDALIARGDGSDPHGPPDPPGGGAPPDEEPVPALSAHDEAHQTVKVDTLKLDTLVDVVGELVIAQSILVADPAIAGSQDERLLRRIAQVVRITSELQRNALSMRMVPIRQTFQKMARLVRELSHKANKPVELTLSGEDTELDRKVIEHVTDPLMHMIRNTIDHAVEPADVRAAAGKPLTASIRLCAFHQASNIVVEIADDGAGLKTEKILAKAIDMRLVPPGATLTEAEIHQLIFRPGFSTADAITELSGRGVGMDVVRANIEALRGRIELQTAKGVGTKFSIRLPLTLAIVDGILLRVGAERFVIPSFAVRESLRPSAEQLHTIHDRARILQVRERLMPMLHLGEAFHIAGAGDRMADATIVVIEEDSRPLAVVVDELIGRQEVVIKTLGTAFERVRGVAGGAILGDGRVGLILDAGGLFTLVEPRAVRAAA